MVGVSAIAGVMSALKGAKDISETMIGLRDTAAFQDKQLELQRKIIDAQSSVFAANEERAELLGRVSELEKEIAELRSWEQEKELYKLTSVARGVAVYLLKECQNPADADHWLCANCFAENRKTFLQRVPISTGRSEVVVCHRCRSTAYTVGQAHADHAAILAKIVR
jgi:hypothetical protein